MATTPPPAKTELLPLFPLATVLVPGMPLALHVFEQRYRQLVADLLGEHQPEAPVFGVVALRQGFEVGQLSDVYAVGTTARVTDVLPHADGRCDLAAVGEQRFAIHSLDTASQPYLMATVSYLAERDGEMRPGAAAAVRRARQVYLGTLAALSGQAVDAPDAPAEPRALSYSVAQLGSLPLVDRQLLLTSTDTAQRLDAARSVLRRESELIRVLHAVPASAESFRAGAAQA